MGFSNTHFLPLSGPYQGEASAETEPMGCGLNEPLLLAHQEAVPSRAPHGRAVSHEWTDSCCYRTRLVGAVPYKGMGLCLFFFYHEMTQQENLPDTNTPALNLSLQNHEKSTSAHYKIPSLWQSVTVTSQVAWDLSSEVYVLEV